MTSRHLRALLALGPALLLTTSTVATPAATSAASQIVVRGTFKSLKGQTITYTSSKGTYSATWIGVKQYKLAGRISGRRLTGTIRTRPAADGKNYVAKGSGRLGDRAVKIGGGGPNDLKSATLILR